MKTLLKLTAFVTLAFYKKLIERKYFFHTVTRNIGVWITFYKLFEVCDKNRKGSYMHTMKETF